MDFTASWYDTIIINVPATTPYAINFEADAEKFHSLANFGDIVVPATFDSTVIKWGGETWSEEVPRIIVKPRSLTVLKHELGHYAGKLGDWGAPDCTLNSPRLCTPVLLDPITGNPSTFDLTRDYVPYRQLYAYPTRSQGMEYLDYEAAGYEKSTH